MHLFVLLEERGLWAYCSPEQFTLLTPEGDRGLYKWGSTIEHYFCATCGCTTYGVSPEWVDYKPHPTKRKIGVNARLFNDFDLAAVKVESIDGKNLW